MEKGLSRGAGFTGMVGWGRLVSTPVTLICILEIFLCCAKLCSKVELSSFCSVLNHFLIQWWGGAFPTMLVCPGWDEEGDRLLKRVGSCQAWKAWFCPQWDSLVHFHLILNWGSCSLRWTTWQKYLPFINPSCWMSASFFFSNVLVWTLWRSM